MGQPLKKQTAAVRIGLTPLGRGVFARRRFRPQQVIGIIHGRVIDDPDYVSDYCMELGDGLGLEPAAPFRYVNHCCQPNCEIFWWEAEVPEPRDRLWLQALTRIEPGDELTIDYAWSADAAIPCKCGAAECRGWIVSPEQLPLLSQHVG